MMALPRGSSSKTLGRVRWFFGSVERQTAQSHPKAGTPVEVPVPRKRSRRVPVRAEDRSGNGLVRGFSKGGRSEAQPTESLCPAKGCASVVPSAVPEFQD